MGDYTHLRHKFEPFEKSITKDHPLAAWYAKVEEFKVRFLGTESGENANALRLAAEFALRKEEKDQHEACISQLNIELEGLSRLGIDAMENEGIQKAILSNGRCVRIDDLPFSSIQNKPEAITWLLENKMPEMVELSVRGLNGKQFDALLAWGAKQKIEISLDVNTKTLQAFVRDRVKKGMSLPEWVKVWWKTKLAVKSAKNGDGESSHDR